MPAAAVWRPAGGSASRVYREAIETAERRGARVRTLAAGDRLRLRGGTEIECFHPPPDAPPRAAHTPLVLRIADGPRAVMLWGAADPAAHRRVLALARDLDAPVLVTEREPEWETVPAAAAARVGPETVILCGDAPPSFRALAFWEGAADTCWLPDEDGALELWKGAHGRP
jgi:hypothetical protein